MGQKVNPNGLRLGISRDWSSRWFANKENVSKYLLQDIAIREYLEEKLKDCVTSHIDIERVRGEIKVSAHVQFVGKLLADQQALEQIKTGLFEVVNGHHTKKQLQQLKSQKQNGLINTSLNVFAVEHPNLDAVLVAKDIAKQLEGRGTARVVQKRAIAKVRKAGAKGIKTMVKGRIGGVEIARGEQYRDGVLSLHTLSANIDYAVAEAHTTYGILGCKVWIARPDNFKEMEKANNFQKRGPRQANRNGAGNGKAPRKDANSRPQKQAEKKGE